MSIDVDKAIKAVDDYISQVDMLLKKSYRDGKDKKSELDTTIQNFVRIAFLDGEKKLEDYRRTVHFYVGIVGREESEEEKQEDYVSRLKKMRNHLVAYKEELRLRSALRKEVKKIDQASKRLSKNIFIVHGRDDKPKLELARMLEKLGFNAIILSEQPDKGRTIIEKLEQETIDIGYAFVILTPDDVGALYEKFKTVEDFILFQKEHYTLRFRARQNVILELGYFVGKIGRSRVCCLYKGEVELPSDIHGVLFKKFNESVEECYKGILYDLKAAGYEIKI